MTNYVSTLEVLKIHFRMIKRYGGSHGVRDLGLLESAIARPQATFGDIELYPNLFIKSAVLIHSLLKNHPFIDGNKRTAVTSCALFFKRNGYQLVASKKEFVDFALNIENNSLSKEIIAQWFQSHVRKVEK